MSFFMRGRLRRSDQILQSAAREVVLAAAAAVESLESRRLLAADLVWAPQLGSNVWDHTTPNWIDTSTNQQVIFADGDNVRFGDSAAGTVAIDVGGVSPGSTVVEAEATYSLQGGPIAGGGDVVKQGTGLLQMDGANTYDGATFVSAGTLRVGNAAALGSTTGATSVAAAGTLELSGQTISEILNLDGGATLGTGTVATQSALNGTVTLTGGIAVLTGGKLTLNGMIIGAGGLSVTGTPGFAAIYTFTNNSNNYSGGTIVDAAQTRITANNALGSGPIDLQRGNLELVSTTPLNIPNALNASGLPLPGQNATVLVDDSTVGSGGNNAEVTHVISGPINIPAGRRLDVASRNFYNLRFTGAMINDGWLVGADVTRVDIAGPYSSPDASTLGRLSSVGIATQTSQQFTDRGMHIMNNLPTMLEQVDQNLIVENGPSAPVTLTALWLHLDANVPSPLVLRNGSRFNFAGTASIDSTAFSTTGQFRIFGDLGGGGTVEFDEAFKADPNPAVSGDEFANLHMGGLSPTFGPLTVITNASQNLPVSAEFFDLGAGATWNVRTNPHTYAGTITVTTNATIETVADLALTGTAQRLTVIANRTLTVANGGGDGRLVLQQVTSLAGSLAVLGTVDHGVNNLRIAQTLSGTGSILGSGNTIVSGSASVASPGSANGAAVGTLSATNLVLGSGSDYTAQLSSTGDELNVTGSVTLSGSTLVASGSAAADSYTIINNDGADAVVGTFSGLPEGATLVVNGKTFMISYVGGDGNDVVLMVPQPINTPPVAIDDAYSVDEDGTLFADDAGGSGTLDPNDDGVLTNDTDLEGDTLTAVLVAGPSHGTLALNADGTFTYEPDEDFAGVDTFTYKAHDGEEESDVATVTITVTPSTPGAQVIPDPCGDGNAVLVNGGSGDDTVHVNPAGGTGEYEIILNGASLGTFNAGRILIRAEEGHDNVMIAGTITTPVWAFGESGNDRIYAGGNASILIGGSGSDELLGGSGRDLMVGGQGGDRLIGNSDDDILVAGFTDHDNNYDALCHVMDEWTRTDSDFATRVDHLSGSQPGGLNGLYFFDSTTVHDDTSIDQIDLLTGSSGNDWYIYENGEDKATGVSATEAGEALLT